MTSMVPETCAGAVAVIDVAETTVNEAAAVPPNETEVAPLKPLPVIVTLAPPVVDPLEGLRLVMAGAGV